MSIMKPKRDVGIVGYGAYVPRFRIRAEEIARVWSGAEDGLPIEEKAVPGLDEDTVTMSIEAARNALARAEIDPQQLRAVWIGSESHPTPSNRRPLWWRKRSARPARSWQAIGNSRAKPALKRCRPPSDSSVLRWQITPWRFGMDTAQGRPGDALEYTAGAGGAAYINRTEGTFAGVPGRIVLVRDRHPGLFPPRTHALSRTRQPVYG